MDGIFRQDSPVIEEIKTFPLGELYLNILQEELDKNWRSGGHCFCRYADDANVYQKTENKAR